MKLFKLFKVWRVSHLLLLVVMVVIIGRLVRSCWEVVRSIALVVHHIQATHSDGAELLMWRREGRRRETAHNTTEGDSSLLWVQTCCILWIHRCLHICPNAYNSHVVQFAYRQCALLLCAPPAPPGATKWIKNGMRQTHCILKKKKKKNSSLTSFQTSSDWLSYPFPPSLSFCFGGELYLERAGAIYSRPPGKGLHGAVEMSKAL